MNEREIFLAAVAISDRQIRTSFLDSVCQQDKSLRQRLENLLAAHEQPQVALDRIPQIIQTQLSSGAYKLPDSLLPAWFEWLEPGTQLGRYTIIERIGTGGMGEVHAALDEQLSRKVALKLLAPTYTKNQKWLKRFQREACAASALNHPNVLTIYEVGEADGIHFIATEFIDGITLRQHLGNKSFKLPQAVGFATQIASALAAAHAANIVHRDIKPENVMVRPDGWIKVLDFGLAKQLDPMSRADVARDEPTIGHSQVLTTPGLLVGTFRYMSPEQARGIDVDTRSDIFSFGTVLFEMVAGCRPFDGGSASDIVASILEHEPPPLARYFPNASAELERIILKCLRKDRDERYQTAKDLHLDLKQLHREIDDQSSRRGLKPNVSKSTDKKDFADPSARHEFADSTNDTIPEVRYARSGDVNIAYQVFGHGTIDLVFVMGWVSHLEWFWKEPSFARFLNRLGSIARVILFDKRGTGLSDRVPLDQLPTLEQRMDDVRAVMDAVGSQRAVLCGVSEGGPMCSLFAATYPEKTIALAMIGCYARRMQAPDYPWGPTDQQREQFLEEIRRDWGGPVGIEARAPSRAADPEFRDWWGTYLRMGASPGAALALTRMNAQIDVRPILPTIQVPTLVIHRRDDHCLLVEEGRYLAQQIPGAKFVELPGNDHLPFVGDQDSILDEIEEFLTGVRHSPQLDRVLATVLFARVTGSASGLRVTAAESGQVSVYHSHTVREIELFKGKAAEITDETILATFDGPARAIRAALAIGDSARRLGLRLQTGLHTGECDVLGDKVSGIAVELAIQIAERAAPDQVLVSSIVKDLVAGAGITFKPQTAIVLPAPFRDWKILSVER